MSTQEVGGMIPLMLAQIQSATTPDQLKLVVVAAARLKCCHAHEMECVMKALATRFDFMEQQLAREKDYMTRHIRGLLEGKLMEPQAQAA